MSYSKPDTMDSEVIALTDSLKQLRQERDESRVSTHNEGVICVSKQGDGEYGSRDLERLVSSDQYLGDLTDEMMFRRRILEAEIAFVGNKDRSTQEHSFRVANYGKKLAEKIGLKEEQEDVYLAGLLQDVGKTAIPDKILKKRGKLDDAQFEKMKSHVVEGARILSSQLRPLKNTNGYDIIVDAALRHHEMYDGNGYPDRLQGEQIPLIGRVLAVVDAFDAMAIKRCYRGALPVDQVVGQIKEGMGSQFDPEIARAFLQIHPQLAWLDLKTGTYHTPHCDSFVGLPIDRFALSDFDRLEALHKTRCAVCYTRG